MKKGPAKITLTLYILASILCIFASQYTQAKKNGKEMKKSTDNTASGKTGTNVKGKRSYRLISSVIFFLYIGAVMFLCLANLSPEDLKIDPAKYFLGIRLDRIIHFLMFLPFTFVCWFYLRYHIKVKLSNAKVLLLLIFLGILFAIAAETSQSIFTTYREFDPLDMVANFAGVISGLFIVFVSRQITE